MGRTAPAPNVPAPPGMAPGAAVKAGGGSGGGSGGKGAGSKGGGSGGGPGGDGSGAGGGDQGAGAGSPDSEKYKPCGTKSCPIDVGTGRMYTLPEEDLYLPGPLALAFERRYSSFASRRDVGLGYGWVHSYAWEVVVTPTKTVVWTNTGTWEDFPLLEPGEEAQGKWGWILRRETDGFVLDTDEGVWRAMKQSDDGVRFRLTEEYDRNGNRVQLTYQGGVLTLITDSVGREVRVDATPEGRIAALSMKNAEVRGRRIFFARYEYDDRGDLVRVTDADGFFNRYVYDDRARHLMIENGYKTGLVFFFRYDSKLRCVESYGAYPGRRDPSLADNLPKHLTDGKTPVRGVHHVRVMYYDDGMREVFDPARLETYHINQHGLIDLEDIGGAVTTATFRDDGWVMSETDALGGTTTFERDLRGRVIKQTDVHGSATVYERDHRGLVTRVIDPEGAVTEITRDARGNVELARNAEGGVTTYRRDTRGVLVSVSDTRGATTHYGYDHHANLTTVTLPNGSSWQMRYDNFGRVVVRTDPLGATTGLTYSDRGNLSSQRNPLGEVVRYSYDGDGSLTQIDSALHAVTKFSYGGLRKLSARVDANGCRVLLRYNHDGQLLEVHNEAGNIHSLRRDSNGRVVGETTLDGHELRYASDIIGRTVRIENAAGELTEFAYDAASQLVERIHHDGVGETFGYNRRGELVGVRSDVAEVVFERDRLGRIVRESQTVDGVTHWVTVEYDGEGERIGRRTSLGHTEVVTRDALGARQRTVLDGAHALGYITDPLGREVARQLPAGGHIETAIDPLGRVARRRGHRAIAGEDAVTVDTSYQYSADGDLVRATDLGRGSAEMRYDPIGQLLALVPEEAKQELFHFDVCGNVFEADDGAPPRSYGKGNRLLAHGDTRLVWDDDGRLVEKWVSAEEVWRYSWNGAGKLSEVEAPNGDVVRFGYDAFARRVTKEVHVRQPGGANVLRDRTRFVWDGEVLAHEVKERSVHKGDPVVAERTYVFEDDSFEPVAHKESGAWYHYVNDPIGTPERLLDAAGNVAGDLRRSAWGKTETDPSSESTTPIRFAGQYADEETGLSYNFFRYYDPETAQYIQRDPIGLVGGLHAYAYAPNPFLWIDPLGLAVNTPNTGVVYLRTDPVTGKQYVGKSKSKEAYERRKKAHDRKKKKGCAGHPGCDFQELETGIGGEPALSQAEEDWIRVGGGPGGRPGQTGPLENKVHGQASDKYNGNIPFP